MLELSYRFKLPKINPSAIKYLLESEATLKSIHKYVHFKLTILGYFIYESRHIIIVLLISNSV